MELEGITHNAFSFNILINCFYCLRLADFDFSSLGKMLKLGVEPNVITLSTLINRLCVEGKVAELVKSFDEMVRSGYHPDLITYGTIVNGLCKIRKTSEAVGLVRRMREYAL
ncbi:hypothetical protein SLA2020_424120 [Shorea laevis]